MQLGRSKVKVLLKCLLSAFLIDNGTFLTALCAIQPAKSAFLPVLNSFLPLLQTFLGVHHALYLVIHTLYRVIHIVLSPFRSLLNAHLK